MQVLAHQSQGHLAPALAALERALRLAEPEGYVRIFADEGPPMAHLLSEAAAREMLPDYTGKLLTAFESEWHQFLTFHGQSSLAQREARQLS